MFTTSGPHGCKYEKNNFCEINFRTFVVTHRKSLDYLKPEAVHMLSYLVKICIFKKKTNIFVFENTYFKTHILQYMLFSKICPKILKAVQ